MNKKILFFFLTAFTAVSGTFYLLSGDKKNEDTRIQGPGYFDQFKRMRLGDLQEYPSGLYNLWNQKSFAKNGVDVIDSINEIGPYNVGGRTRAILVDLLNPNRMIVGGISGGIWISDNRGFNWRRINDHEINMNVTCITQDPFDPAYVYYGTGEGAGNSAAAPGAGIFRSNDGGNSFKQLPSTANADFEYCWSIKSSLKNPAEIYVTTNARGVFRSQDSGETWKKIFATGGVVHDIELFPDGSVMFGLKNVGVYKSHTGDSGTFFKVGDLPSAGIGRIELAYCREYSNVVYASIANTGDASYNSLWKSSDTGNSWVIKTPPTVTGISFPFTWYCFTMGVKNNDSNSLVIGSVNMGYSKDGGKSWAKMGDSHADNHVVSQHPNDTGSFILGNDGGVWGYTWKSPNNAGANLNNGLNITQFYHGSYAPTGLTVIGGTQDNGSHFALNSAAVFKKLYGADGAYAQINQQNPSIGYVSTQNGNILRSKNMNSGSPTFSNVRNQLDADDDGDINDGAWFINPYFINPRNGSQLFFPTKRRLWRTLDGGDNWVPVTKFINAGSAEPYSLGLSHDESPMAYLGGASGLLYRIRNVLTDTPGMEKNMKLISSTPVDVKTSFISCIRVHPRYKSTVFLSLSNYSDKPRIWKVTRADSDTPVWTPINGNLPLMLPVGSFDLHPDNPDSVIIAGTDFGVYVTMDAGKTWVKDTRVPNVVVDEVIIRSSDRKAFIFTHGRGVWVAHMKTLPSPFLSAKGEAKLKPALKLYPNPATDWIQLQIPGYNGQTLELNIHNMEGRLVREMKLEDEQRIDVSVLQSGIYILSVRGPGISYTSKFIKK